MARCRNSISKRDAAIKETFSKLSKGRCAKWRYEEILKEVADLFYLSKKRVSNILAA